MSKILYIGGFELPDKNAAAHRVLGNAKALRELGYEVVFVGLTKEKASKEALYYNGFKYYELPYPDSLIQWMKYLSRISEIKNILELEGQVGAIIAYNYPALALDKLRKLKLKVYADCTEWYEPQGNFIYKILKGLDVYYRMHIVHKKLNGVIVISDFLEEFYKEKVRTINIPPLVDINDLKWEHVEKSDKSIYLTYSGSPGTGKKDRLDKVIRVIELINKTSDKKVNLNVVGLTEQQYLESFAKERVNIERVRFYGRLSHLNSLEIIKKSHFFIFFRDANLTNTAGFPTKFVEALTLGVPVVTNSSSNIKSYIDKNKNLGFLVNLNDDESEIGSKVVNFINIFYDEHRKELTLNDSFHYSKYLRIFYNFLSNQ